MRAVCWPGLVGVLLCLLGCLGDPLGPGGTLVVRRLTPVDSVLVGAPGRPLPTAITFQAVDGDGRPVPGAIVEWTVLGTNGRVEEAPAATDSKGEVTATWILGTNASESQRLTTQVRLGKHQATSTLAAVAKPVEVSSVAFGTHDTTVVKLGAPKALGAQATDPFGNRFTPPGMRFVSLDTMLFAIDSTGLVAARKRGVGQVVVAAAGAADTVWVHATQVVKSIVASPDTLMFHSLGQTAILSVRLVDDQGHYVRDSLPGDSVAVDSVVSIQPGKPFAVRSVANGATPVILRAGAAAQAVQVLVNQRVARVKLSGSRTTFDALGDTLQLSAQLADSVGAPLVGQVLVYSSSDSAVATVGSGGLVTSKANGAAWLHARAATGVGDSLRLLVAQQVARVVVKPDSLLLDALQAVLPVQATLVDRLGSPVVGPAITYATGNPAVATADTNGNVRAIGNGSTVLTAMHGADSAAVVVRVAQRPVRVVVPKDTIRFQAFGDTQTVSGVALDSLGSAVVGRVTSVVVADSGVLERVDSVTVRARGNGATTASMVVAGLTRQLAVVVNQVPTTLTVAVTFGNPVITLPAGASMPLACHAADKNGFTIARDPAFVGSVRGTVSGTRCGDARVARSGYDTLSFGLGSIQTRVPVIVSTTADSVGILVAAQPLTTVVRDQYVGEDLANPLILALRPLVADILAAYGNPTTSLGRARAIRDWIARTAIHPYPPLHPDGSTANVSVLPASRTWADVNALYNLKADQDRSYWYNVGWDGYAMLDSLLGTLDPATGLRADNGMMVHVDGARYQIRDIESYRYVMCTFQDIMLNALWAAAGLHGMLASTIGHDPAVVFIPELAQWVYEDPTMNEEYLLDGAGEPLSPRDLLTLSAAGEANRLYATKLPGPTFDPQVYIAGITYLTNGNPNGMVIMGSQVYNRVVGIGGWPTRNVQIDVPQVALQSPFNLYDRVTAPVAFPTLGVVIQQLPVQDSVYTVALTSTFPNHEHFERRLSGGAWGPAEAADVLPVGECRVEYRSVDTVGNVSATAVIDLWVPRAEGFVASAISGSIRSQAQYCVAPVAQ
jgi:hypothetical protein